ncbi:MAG TPA: hypothetical protein VII93_13800, partial [Anaerolineales bacterium]
MSKLNSTTLTIAAILLVILALLVMATPLLRTTTGFTNRTGNRTFTPGSAFPTPQGGFTPGQGFVPGQGGTGTGGTGTGGNTPQRFTGANGGASTLFRIGFLSGVTGTIVYALLLLVSLGASLGMFMTKAWGKILGIIMAIVYALLALVSTVPILLSGFLTQAGGSLGLSIGLNVLHL